MEYAEYLAAQGLSGKTARLYIRHAARADDWLKTHRHTTLAWCGPADIAAYVETLPQTHATIAQVAAAAVHYWDMGDRANPPRRAIRVPPSPEMVCRAIEPDQARDLVKVATGWWPHGTIVLCGLYLALRRFEIAKMEWDRFDDRMEWYTVTGKWDKTNTIPVHPHLRDELEFRRNGSRFVFPGRFPGTHLRPATVWAWTKQVGLEAGIPDLATHELRHTALATANDNTGNLRGVQTFARHAKPTTTAGYTRTTAERLREVSDALTYLE